MLEKKAMSEKKIVVVFLRQIKYNLAKGKKWLQTSIWKVFEKPRFFRFCGVNVQKETCCGVIPLQKKGQAWWVFLIQHRAGGYWSFPKGHVENGESYQETASRELHEETALKVKAWLEAPILQERYVFERGQDKIDKTVYYFLAEVEGNACCASPELLEGKWVMASEAEAAATFPEAKTLCRKVEKWLMTYEHQAGR